MMKKLQIFLVLLLASTTFAQAQTYPTTFWSDLADTSWYNSSQDEFTISTAEELAGVAQLVIGGNTFLNKTFIIDADINLDGNLWTPIGQDNNLPFSGTVEGNDHIISNLWINLPGDDFVGLFGFTSNASFTNIQVDTANIIGFDNTGTLVANLFDNGSIENCSAINVTVTGNNNTGGLVGGFLTHSSILKSHAIGDVTGAVQVGGLAGTGWDEIVINDCYSEGTVSASVLAGGLVGAFVFSFTGASTISNSYSRSSVVASDEQAGGLIGGGVNALTVTSSYATGTVSSLNFAGAIIGQWGNITMENMYFDTESSGMTEGVGGFSGPPSTPDITGKTTAEMKTSELVDLLNAGSTESPWLIDAGINDGYPSFIAPLGVQENSINLASVKVYPTIFDNTFTISSNLELKYYSVYNYLGALISEGTLRNNLTTVTADNFSAGLYILKIRTAEGSISKKIIKK